MRIRHAWEGDAEELLRLRKQLDAETTLMMLEPGERTTTVRQEREEIRETFAAGNRTILIAEEEGHLVGYLEARGGQFNRNRHNAQIVMGVLQDYAGRGIGTSLMAEAENWARQHGIKRLELTVMKHNQSAISLYKKMGFVTEGERSHSLLVDGALVDELYMAKLLD